MIAKELQYLSDAQAMRLLSMASEVGLKLNALVKSAREQAALSFTGG